jgi:hypothetical protein
MVVGHRQSGCESGLRPRNFRQPNKFAEKYEKRRGLIKFYSVHNAVMLHRRTNFTALGTLYIEIHLAFCIGGGKK